MAEMAALNTSASMETSGEASPSGSADQGTRPLLYNMEDPSLLDLTSILL